jgi:hypothetical protein
MIEISDLPALDRADIARLVDAVFDRNVIPAVRGRKIPESIFELELLFADARQRANEQLASLRGFIDREDIARLLEGYAPWR